MLKKKITAYGLLLLMAMPLFFSVMLLLKQADIQKKRLERFESGILQTISLQTEKVLWIKPGKEILIEGKLFDVKYYHVQAGHILLTGLFDTKEDHLVNQLNGISHQQKDYPAPLGQLIIQLLFSPACLSTFDYLNKEDLSALTKVYYSYDEGIFQLNGPVFTPPPRS